MVMLQIIRLSDCVRVSEAGDVDGCPKDCRAFVVETTEKTFVFAVEMVEVDDWMQKLCEIAFPVSKNELLLQQHFSLEMFFKAPAGNTRKSKDSHNTWVRRLSQKPKTNITFM